MPASTPLSSAPSSVSTLTSTEPSKTAANKVPVRSPPSSDTRSSSSTLTSAGPSKTAAPTPNSTSSPTKISTQPHKDPTIVGYLHNVSPEKRSAKGSEYFSFTVQEKEKKIKALCFSPRKHKSNVDTKAESCTPCKLTKFTYHATEEDVIWVNAATQINHALEANVDFPCDSRNNETPVVTTKDLEDIQVYQTVTVRGMVLFGDRRAEHVPTKTDLIKREGTFVDEFGNIPITIWNEQIESTEEGFYEIHNIRLRQFKGQKYLSSAIDTVFGKLTENLPNISEQQITHAKDELKTNEITCDNIQSVDIMVFYNCVTCSKKVQFQQNSPMLRCMTCQSRFLIKNSTKTTTARISVKKGDQTTWYSLFTSTLEAIIEKFNKDNNEGDTIEDIDEDKLCEVILTTKGIKLLVNSTNTVLGISFA